MRPAPPSIRRAGAADNDLLAALGAETFADAFGADNTPADMAAYLQGAFSPAIQAAELADPASLFLLAEIEGEPVGYARLRRGPAPTAVSGERPIEIVRLYARRAWIGLGVGAALMRACLRQAEQARCDTIWLDVWERNPRARAFYARWGFVEVGTQTFVLGRDVQNDLLLQRPVRAGDGTGL